MEASKYLSIAGNQARISKATGLSPRFINQIAKGNRKLPIEHGASFEKASNGQSTRQENFPENWQKIWPELTERENKQG